MSGIEPKSAFSYIKNGSC